MTTNPTGLPRYLRTPDAAKVVGLSIRTLEKHRIYGTGPAIPSSAAASSIRSKTYRPGSSWAPRRRHRTRAR
jgi:hypothetical protein